MKLPNILPPPDLLEQVAGIEEGLQHGKRLGRLGQIGLILSALQALVVVSNSEYLQALLQFDWRTLLRQWPLWLGLGVFFVSLFLLSWRRFWLHESRQPFRYTFSISPFQAVDESGRDWAWLSQWLQYDLSKNLSARIGRLSLLDEQYVHGEGGGQISHVHISGSYLIRRQPNGRWIVEVTPRVRIGPPGSPETLAHTVKYDLFAAPPQAGIPPPEAPEAPSPAPSPPPSLIGTKEYTQLLERIYFSIASQIYRQIRQDVQRKIDLLPGRRFRAAAYYYEADDYAQSNTLDAYDEARLLYDQAMRNYDPRWSPLSASPALRLWQRLGRGVTRLARLLRCRAATLWPGLGEVEVMAAKAELGYVNMLLYRRILAGLSGHRVNPVFEARPIAEHAISRLQGLPANVPARDPSLFDAWITLALAWYYLDDLSEGRACLAAARSLLPDRAETDARYLFAQGEIESRVRSELPFFQRAVELDPKFEIAQFQLAYTTEALWRMRPSLEESVAEGVLEEYERVLEINPGNLGAWSNMGYIHWLLGDPLTHPEHLDKARQAFHSGREYKEIKRETFVAEIDYGLTRIAAEEGDFDRAYRHYADAVSAQISQGFSHGGGLGRFYFSYISESMFQRYRRYKERVEHFWKTYQDSQASKYPQRIVNNVYAFVLNDFGEACYQYYLRNGNSQWLHEAQAAFRLAAELNPSYVIPYYNLYSLARYDDLIEKAKGYIESVHRLAPNWPDGNFALAETLVRWAPKAKERLPEIEKSAAELRQKAEEKRALAERLRQEASRPDLAASQAGRLGLTAFDLEREARKLEKEAERDVENASEKEKDAQRLKGEIPLAYALAKERLRQLLPHRWLWRYQAEDGQWDLAWETLRRPDYAQELVWQRQFNDLHVQALFTWAKNLLYSDAPQREHAKALFDFIRQHFWPNNVDLLLECLEMAPQEREISGRIEAHIQRWRLEDAQAYWPVTWCTLEIFEPGQRVKNLEEVVAQAALSGHTYKWIGDQLLSLGETASALEAYRKGMSADDPALLVEIGETLEKNDALDDCLGAYQRAQALDEKRSQSGQHPVHAAEFYHYHRGRLLWKSGNYLAAIEELGKIPLHCEGLPRKWRTHLVQALLDEDLIDTPQSYRFLHDLLSEQQRQCDREGDLLARRDTAHAFLLLVRQKYPTLGRPTGGYLTSTYPAFTPIVIEADERLFPQGDDWWQEHPLFKQYIPEMRDQIYLESGVSIPGVRVRSQPDLSQGAYALLVFETVFASGQVQAGKRFFPKGKDGWPALKAGAPEPALAFNPQSGDAEGGAWIDAQELQDSNQVAQSWDVFQYIILHLRQTLDGHLDQFVDPQRVQGMLDEWQSEGSGVSQRKLLNLALADTHAWVCLVQVLQTLVREKVPINDLTTILEAFAEARQRQMTLTAVVDEVRLALRSSLPGYDDGRELLFTSPEFEAAVAAGLSQVAGKRCLALSLKEANDLLTRVGNKVSTRSRQVALVVGQAALRPYVQRLVAMQYPELPVLAARELEQSHLLLIGAQVD
jgi:hypothetical protein